MRSTELDFVSASLCTCFYQTPAALTQRVAKGHEAVARHRLRFTGMQRKDLVLGIRALCAALMLGLLAWAAVSDASRHAPRLADARRVLSAPSGTARVHALRSMQSSIGRMAY